MKKAILVVLSIAILAGAGFIWSKYDEWFVYPPLRAHVNDRMKDPASTQYRNEYMTKNGWLCGEVNSKNSMGAYVGFKRFISGSAADAYLEGHDYVGVEESISAGSTRLIEKLDAKTKILKRNNELRESTGFGNPLSDQELEEIATKILFDTRWQDLCAKT